jgi:hypothetical protein
MGNFLKLSFLSPTGYLLLWHYGLFFPTILPLSSLSWSYLYLPTQALTYLKEALTGAYSEMLSASFLYRSCYQAPFCPFKALP